MRPRHGHANARGRDADAVRAEDFVRLTHQLALLFVVAGLVDRTVVAEEVVYDGVRKQLGHHGLVCGPVAHLLFQLGQALGTGTADGLVGAGHHTLHAKRLVQRPERHGQDDRTAVGIGDEPHV